MSDSVTFEEVLANNGRLAYTNVGISMLPLIREGKDVLLIEAVSDRGVHRWDAVLFRRPGVTGRGAYVLHRVLKILPDGRYWIVGDNCISGEMVESQDVLGILTQVQRDNGKIIRVTDLKYRLYVLFWCRPYYIRFFVLRVIGVLRRIKRKIHGI